MASLRNRRGKWYARIQTWDGVRQKDKNIPLRTDSKRTALKRFKKVDKVENDIKSGVIEDIKAFFPWLNKMGSSKIVQLKLIDAIDDWLDSRKKNFIRSTTLEINERALGHFVKCHGRNFPVEKVSLKHIRDFKEKYLAARGYSPTTINLWLRSIRAFLIWLVENEFIKKSPKVKQVPIDEPEVKYLNENEIAELGKLDLSPKNTFLQKGDVFVKEWEHYKKAFKFYLSTGCRKSEPFLGVIKGMWLCIPPNESKNHRARNIQLDDEKLEILNEMRSRLEGYTSVKVCSDSYNKALKKAFRKIGVSNDLSLHNLRHTYGCIRRLQLNGNIIQLRDEMGHTYISTTERYCRIPIMRLEEDFSSYAKTPQNGVKDTLYKDTIPMILGYAPR